MCAVNVFYFQVGYFCLLGFLHRLIYSHSSMSVLFNMILRLNTSWILMLNGTYVVPQKQFLILYLPKYHPCLGKYFVSQTSVQGYL